MFEYESIALDVSWFGTADLSNSDRQKLMKYNDRLSDLLTRWRSSVTKAQVLASGHINDQLMTFWRKINDEKIPLMAKLCNNHADSKAWDSQHMKNRFMDAAARNLVNELVVTLKLCLFKYLCANHVQMEGLQFEQKRPSIS